MTTIEIAGRRVGPGHPAYIIAEAGVNHNGDLRMALELVRQAHQTGADCVKFQTFRAEAIVTRQAPKANYQLQVTDPGESQLDMLKRLELVESDYRAIIGLCRDLGVQFLSTPYNFEDVDFLEGLGVAAYKIASGQIVESPFLEYVARTGKPLIVSTGMATLSEVRRAVGDIRATGNEQLIILQCTTNYPSRVEDSNVRAMAGMRDELGVVVGYSDHTASDHSVYAATALGATVIEKHFTLDRALPGPDHSSSLEPDEFRNLVHGVREIEKALGNARKEPTAAEALNTKGMRRSIVALVDIPAGSVLVREQLAFKRPATGLEPNLLPRLVGKRARRHISADTTIDSDAVEW
jgi:N,N'-diacetyllegionaminate synthase